MNSLIWPTSDVSQWWDGAILCDIQAKLFWASYAGDSGAVAAIMRNLARVMDVDRGALVPTKFQRKREILIELSYCYAYPIFHIATHYIVQSNRYYIFQIVGCTASWDWSWPTIVLIYIWPSIFCLIGSYYTVLVVARLYKYRCQFNTILNSSASKYTKSRFLRLFILSLILLIVYVPVNGFVFYKNMNHPMVPFSWSAIHGPDWWTIYMVPTDGVVRFDRWFSITTGFVIFLFFGLGKDALEMYRCWLVMIGFGKCFPNLKRPSGARTLQSSSGNGSFGSPSRSRWFKNNQLTSTTTNTTTSSTNGTLYRDSVFTQVTTPSPSDPEKTFLPIVSKDPKPIEPKILRTRSSSLCVCNKTRPQSLPIYYPTKPQPINSRSFIGDEEAQHPHILTNVWGGDSGRDGIAPSGTVRVRVDVNQTSEGKGVI
ncbi:MAG: a-factor receptor [Geoglossum simile]|nr:MAG: a-factor receptor [Geoglossum simile]